MASTHWLVFLTVLLSVYADGFSVPSAKHLQFKGIGSFKCLKTNNQTYKCTKGFNASLFYQVQDGISMEHCTTNSIMFNLTQIFTQPKCSLEYVVVTADSSKPNQTRPLAYRAPENPSKCRGEMKTHFHKSCNVRLSQKEFDFLRLCNAFNIKDAFQTCTCDMFKMFYNGSWHKLCDIFHTVPGSGEDLTKVVLNVKSNNFETILKRTCVYFNTTNNCSCSDFKVLKQNSNENDTSINFCKPKTDGGIKIEGLPGLCKHFGIKPEDCHCSLFNFSSSSDHNSVCEFLENKVVRTYTYKPKYQIPFAAVETVSSTIGIFGNLLVVLIAVRFRRGLATCKKLIAHLAAYDLFFAFFQLMYALPKFWTGSFIYGETICKIMTAGDYLGSFLAIGIILIISIERFIGIVNPFRRGIPKKGLQAILYLNFIIAFIAVIPLLMYYHVDDLKVCKATWPRGGTDALIYRLVILIAYLIIPVLVVTTLYIIIICTLRGTVIVGKTDFIADPRIRQKRIQDNRRTMCVLIGVVVAFVIFVFPKHVIVIHFVNQGWDEYITTPEMTEGKYYTLMYIAYFSYPFHVAINPIIYSLIDSRWRNDAKHLLSRWSTRRQSAYSATMTSTVNRRRSSAATVLGDQTPKRRLTQANNNNNIKQLIVTTNGKNVEVSPIPTPLTSLSNVYNGDVWMGEGRSTNGSAFTFAVPYESNN